MGFVTNVKEVGVAGALRRSRLSMVHTGLQEAGRMVRSPRVYFSALKPHVSGRAVVVIDMLNDFLSGQGTLSAKLREGGIDELLAANNRVIDAARRQGIPVIYVCEGHKWNDDEFKAHGNIPGWPRHGVRRTWGAQVHPDISQPERQKEWIFKPTLSAFANTRLNDVLQALGVKEIFIMGVATDYCIKKGAIEGVRNYKVTVVSDAIKPVDLNKGDGDAAIAEMKNAQVSFLSSKAAEVRLLGKTYEGGK